MTDAKGRNHETIAGGFAGIPFRRFAMILDSMRIPARATAILEWFFIR
jgi:hypothetical protein